MKTDRSTDEEREAEREEAYVTLRTVPGTEEVMQPGPRPAMRLVGCLQGRNDDDRAGSSGRNVVRHAPEHRRLHPSPAAGAEHDERRPFRLADFEYAIGGGAVLHPKLCIGCPDVGGHVAEELFRYAPLLLGQALRTVRYGAHAGLHHLARNREKDEAKAQPVVEKGRDAGRGAGPVRAVDAGDHRSCPTLDPLGPACAERHPFEGYRCGSPELQRRGPKQHQPGMVRSPRGTRRQGSDDISLV